MPEHEFDELDTLVRRALFSEASTLTVAIDPPYLVLGLEGEVCALWDLDGEFLWLH